MSKTRRKPQAGACRICGCAVLQPTPSQFARAQKASTCGRFWVMGHLYEVDDRHGIVRLTDVVCDQHAYDREGDDTRFGWEGEKLGLGYMQRRGAS